MIFAANPARLLRWAIAPVAVSLGLMTGVANAAVVDFEFTTKVWSYGLHGYTGSDFPGGSVQGSGWSSGGGEIYFDGGFFHNASVYGATFGKAVFSLTPRTYGPADLPSAFTGGAAFAVSLSPLFFSNISSANIGFLSSSGNYGYVVFDWDAITATLTFVSGQYESTPGVAIAVATVPAPAALPLMLGGIAGLGLLARRKRA